MPDDGSNPMGQEEEHAEPTDHGAAERDTASIPDRLESLISPILGLPEPERSAAADHFCKEHPEQAILMRIALAQIDLCGNSPGATRSPPRSIGRYIY